MSTCSLAYARDERNQVKWCIYNMLIFLEAIYVYAHYKISCWRMNVAMWLSEGCRRALRYVYKSCAKIDNKSIILLVFQKLNFILRRSEIVW